MRIAVVEALADLAARDRRVVLLTGDLGWSVVERFADRFPDRFINGGVAEQNLVGMATGLAEAGYLPFVYSISTFATLRPYEFLRDGPMGMRLPVRVLGVGGGFDYGSAGATHYGLEDLAILRLLSGSTVLAPADAAQACAALRATWDLPGLVYLRLAKDERPAVPGLDGRFRLGRVEVVREPPRVQEGVGSREVENARDAKRVLLLATGGAAATACEAAHAIEAEGIAATVAVVACLSPEPRDDLTSLLARHRAVVTVEEHVRPGGLFGLVADVVATGGHACRVEACHARPELLGPVGRPSWLRERHGLSVAAVSAAARTSTVPGTRTALS